MPCPLRPTRLGLPQIDTFEHHLRLSSLYPLPPLSLAFLLPAYFITRSHSTNLFFTLRSGRQLEIHFITTVRSIERTP